MFMPIIFLISLVCDYQVFGEYPTVNNEVNVTKESIETWNVKITTNDIEHLRDQCIPGRQNETKNTAKVKRVEVVRLEIDPVTPVLCHQDSTPTNDVCDVSILFKPNPALEIKIDGDTELAIQYVHYFHGIEKRFSCIKIRQNLTRMDQAIFRLQPDRDFKRAEIYVGAYAAGGEVFEQKINFLSPRYCLSTGLCPLERFSYSDSTSVKGKDKIYVSKYSAQESSQNGVIFYLVGSTASEKWELLKTFFDTNEIVQTLPASRSSRFYKITTHPSTIAEPLRVYKVEVISAAVITFICLMIIVAVLLWHLSRPQRKSIIVIHCQCTRHAVIADAMRQLWRFMEKNCYMEVKEASITASEESQLESEAFIGTNDPDFVLFVPFPVITDHDQLYESDMHQLCGRLKTSKNKFEVLLPFDENVKVYGSDWPRNSYRDFRFLEETEQFLKLVHPCFYPRCLEKYLRHDLWGPALEDKLSLNTYTNDHLRQVINTKFEIDGCDKKHRNSTVNIDLDVLPL